MSNEALNICLRVAGPEDEAFLYEVYKATRAEEMAAWGWDAAQQDAFLRMQFRAQQMSYQAEDVGTKTEIILLDEESVGRIIVKSREYEIQLVDIALLTEYRGRGIGTSLIKELIEEAGRAGKFVRLHVLKTNFGARRLYERLGFKVTGESGMHFGMERAPDAFESPI
ncbi:MAG: GNAT family N-acetyltransferase [Acidobacteriota bacterium]|nr:GNAT family N-acetyltransferase [Acidobacteriota bacterium]